MRRPFSHVWLCNCSILNFLIKEEKSIFFFYQCAERTRREAIFDLAMRPETAAPMSIKMEDEDDLTTKKEPAADNLRAVDNTADETK